MHLNIWNLGLAAGKQPDADLGGPAPVDAVPTPSPTEVSDTHTLHSVFLHTEV